MSEQSCKRIKTAAPAVEKLTLVWKAKQSATQYPVVISAPSADDTCAIACESIATASLDWLDSRQNTFLLRQPALKKATLPCGHSFSVIQIAYHFTKNNMRCPICRKGEDNTMLAQCLPRHLRASFLKHAQSCLVEEEVHRVRSELIETNDEVLRLIQQDIRAYLPFSAHNHPETVTMAFTVFSHSNVQLVRGDLLIKVSAVRSPSAPTTYFIPPTVVSQLCAYIDQYHTRALDVAILMDDFKLCDLPRISWPFCDAETGALTPPNEAIAYSDPFSQRAYINTVDPVTASRQAGAVAFEHGAHAGGLSFITWHPVPYEVQHTIVERSTLVFHI